MLENRYTNIVTGRFIICLLLLLLLLLLTNPGAVPNTSAIRTTQTWNRAFRIPTLQTKPTADTCPHRLQAPSTPVPKGEEVGNMTITR
ncbi:unnamed protein product [Alternaria alternata]